MKRMSCLVLVLWLAAGAAQPDRHAFAIAREFEQMASRAYWPGYAPGAIPLAVFDGRQTLLFRHPSPPDGFRLVGGTTPPAHAYVGRHPAVTSNSSAEIGGVATATVLADGERAALPARTLAAVAIHEAFHVFQRARHPSWSGNEGDLLLYPVDDARLLALRRMETEALRRALSGRDEAAAVCWAKSALVHRQERFAGMDSVFGRYERLTELNEGLATYVQLLARDTALAFPADEFAAADVRARSYVVGPALALLLDRVNPGWKRSLESDDTQALDRMLAHAVAARATGPSSCRLEAAERSAIERAARADSAAVESDRIAKRRAFDARTGWRIVVRAAPDRPLWPQGFDPLNVERVQGALLHSRFLRLGNDAGELSAIDESGVDVAALTVAAGAHPLFNGIREAVITGMARPDVIVEGAEVRIKVPGFALRFSNATAREQGNSVVVELRGAT